MTTYSKETALYDTGAIKNGIDEAATTATNYLTTISGTTGISVHTANDEKNFVNMNSTDGVTIYRNIDGTATDVANFGEKIRVGKEDDGNIYISSDGMRGRSSSETLFEIVENGASESRIVTTTVPIDVELTTTSNYEYMSDVIDSINTGSEFRFVAKNGRSGHSFNVSFNKGTQQTATKSVDLINMVVVYDGSKTFTINAYYGTCVLASIGIGRYLTIETPSFTFGTRNDNSANGSYSMTAGTNNESSGNRAVAFGNSNTASGDYSFASGDGSKALGSYSQAMGRHVIASDNSTFAIGKYNVDYYREEVFSGDGTTTSFTLSETVDELMGCFVNGVKQSVNFNRPSNTVTFTPAPIQGATILIKYIIDSYAFVIGNGTVLNPSNALTVDWNGGIRTTPEFIPTNVTSTKGTYVSSECYRFGQVVCLSLVFRNTSSVAAGADIYTATFTSTLPRPVFRVTGASYYGLHSIAGALDTNRGVTIRNASDTAYNIPSNSSAGISFTYITND